MTGETVNDPLVDIRDVIGKAAVQYDQICVEGIDQIVDPNGHILYKKLHHLQRFRNSILIIFQKLVYRYMFPAGLRGIGFQDGFFRGVLFQAAPVSAGTGLPVRKENGVPQLPGIAVFPLVELFVDENAHADAIVNVQMNHIFIVMVKSRFPQYGQIGLIFHDDREPESFFQLFTQILFWQRIIGSEADPVLMDHAVDAHSHAYNAVRRILVLRQVL